jgi:hypothetical protein
MKKVLSLVLVICMAFSLVTIASAANPAKYQEFSDASAIVNKEAVDTLTAKGILAGISGAFNPADNLTREQAAKIICYMLLGATAADGLKTTTSSFTDVAVTRWSAPYIQYCVVKGIINGNGDGTFNPEGNVTGTQFAKMLLTALGYGKLGEYTGTNWAINVLTDAQTLEILDLNVDYNAAATRDQVARYAFNAYTGVKCYIVVLSQDRQYYVPAFDPYTQSVVNGVTTYYYPTYAQRQNVNATSEANYEVIDGIPCYQWLGVNGVALTGNWWPVDTASVLGVSNFGNDLVTKISNSSANAYIAKPDGDFDDVDYYYNGADVTSGTDADSDGVPDSIETASNKRGAIITLIDTDSDGKYNVVTAVVKTVIKLASAPVVSNGFVTVPGVCNKTEEELVDGYKGLAKNDYVLYYEDAATDVIHITKATTVQGSITGTMVNSGIQLSYATIGGKMVFNSGLVAFDGSKSLPTFINSNNLNNDVTAYLDDAGCVVAIVADDESAAKTYGLVLDYNYPSSSLSSTAYVRLLKQDGTVSVYQQALEGDGSVEDLGYVFEDASGNPLPNQTAYLVAYTINSDGKIVIDEDKYAVPSTTAIAGVLSPAYDADGNASMVSITDGVNPANTYYISSSTKVFYFNNDLGYGDTILSNGERNDGSVTTGFENTIDADEDVIYILKAGSNTIIDAILFDSDESVSSTSSFAYTVWGGGGAKKTVNGTDYWDYGVYIDGQYKVLTGTEDGLFPAGGVYKYKLNAQGYVYWTDPDDSRIVKGGLFGEITNVDAAGTYFVYETGASSTAALLTDADTKYYEVDNSVANIPGSITPGAVSESTDNVKYTLLFAAQDSDGVATEVFYTYNVI